MREQRTRHLSETSPDRCIGLYKRLALARSRIGALDPLEFLEQWIAPGERSPSGSSRDNHETGWRERDQPGRAARFAITPRIARETERTAKGLRRKVS